MCLTTKSKNLQATVFFYRKTEITNCAKLKMLTKMHSVFQRRHLCLQVIAFRVETHLVRKTECIETVVFFFILSFIFTDYTIEWAATKYVHFSAVQQGSNVMLQQGVYDGMWNQQNEIGCAYITTPITGIECAFAPKSTTNYYIPLYTAGPGCTSNSQCTTGIYNKCDTALKLCYS